MLRGVSIFLLSLGCTLSLAEPSAAQTSGAPPNTTSASIPFRCDANPVGLIIRRDFTDIGWFLCPDSAPQSVGAQVSATYNARSPQTTASVDGVGALVYRYYGDHAPLIGVAIGPYLQGDGTNQFEMTGSPSKDTDTIGVGGFLEAGIEHFGGASFFRIRDGEVFAPAGVESNSFVGEWLPTIPGLLIHYPFPLGPFTARFDPELMVQYDQLDSGKPKYLLFLNQSSALRIGPQLSLWLNVAPLTIYPEPLREVFKSTFLTATYHVDQDADTGRNYAWSLVTLTHNLDAKGNFAISASYGFGNSETTGNRTDQVKVGLSGKL